MRRGIKKILFFILGIPLLLALSGCTETTAVQQNYDSDRNKCFEQAGGSVPDIYLPFTPSPQYPCRSQEEDKKNHVSCQQFCECMKNQESEWHIPVYGNPIPRDPASLKTYCEKGGPENPAQQEKAQSGGTPAPQNSNTPAPTPVQQIYYNTFNIKNNKNINLPQAEPQSQNNIGAAEQSASQPANTPSAAQYQPLPPPPAPAGNTSQTGTGGSTQKNAPQTSAQPQPVYNYYNTTNNKSLPAPTPVPVETQPQNSSASTPAYIAYPRRQASYSQAPQAISNAAQAQPQTQPQPQPVYNYYTTNNNYKTLPAPTPAPSKSQPAYNAYPAQQAGNFNAASPNYYASSNAAQVHPQQKPPVYNYYTTNNYKTISPAPNPAPAEAQPAYAARPAYNSYASQQTANMPPQEAAESPQPAYAYTQGTAPAAPSAQQYSSAPEYAPNAANNATTPQTTYAARPAYNAYTPNNSGNTAAANSPPQATPQSQPAYNPPPPNSANPPAANNTAQPNNPQSQAAGNAPYNAAEQTLPPRFVEDRDVCNKKTDSMLSVYFTPYTAQPSDKEKDKTGLKIFCDCMKKQGWHIGICQTPDANICKPCTSGTSVSPGLLKN